MVMNKKLTVGRGKSLRALAIGGLFFLTYLPLMAILPGWVGVVVTCGAVVRLYMDYWDRPPLTKIVQNILALAFFFLTLSDLGMTINRVSGSALLASMISLKITGGRSTKDDWEVVALLFILLGAGSFFRGDLLWALYFVSVCILLFLYILYQNSPKGFTLGGMVSYEMRSLFFSIPLTALLFVVYPRLPSGMVGIGVGGVQGETGISPELAPGKIASLIPLNRIDFRVFFKMSNACNQPYYWRVYTLERYDGDGAWRHEGPGGTLRPGLLNEPAIEKNACCYRVETVHGRGVVLALDWPVKSMDKHLIIRDDLTVAPRKKGSQPINYEICSTPDYSMPSEPYEGADLNKYLELPRTGNPRTRRLARSICTNASSPRAMIHALEAFFRDGEFSYTLNPGQLPKKDAIDAFLFDKRSGFCEHYASSFAYLLRLCQIPSRVVVGYLGGEMNPVGDYLVVKSSSAHAWVEAYYQGKWYRIDPTGLVETRRIIAGNALDTSASPFTFHGILVDGYNLVLMGLDALDHYWETTVMDFGVRDQRSLLRHLGLSREKSYNFLILFSILFITIGGVLFFYFSVPRLFSSSPLPYAMADHLLKLFLLLLRPYGLKRGPWEGPLTLSESLNDLPQEIKKEASMFLGHYIEAVYAKSHPRRRDIFILRRTIRKLISITYHQ